MSPSADSLVHRLNKDVPLNSTIVIPVRNDALRLKRCLDSIQSLGLAIDIVVVDNGSTDDSIVVAQSAGAKVLSFPGINVGALRNRGVEISVGNVIAFVDSDHELTSNWLENGLNAIESGFNVLAAGSHYLPPESGTWVQATWSIHRLRGPELQAVDWLGSGNLFVRRDAFDHIGGFREDLVAAEDVDLCYRLRQLGGIIVCDKRIRNIHHGEPATLVAFVRKEYWRGSSGVRAWLSQGFPLCDLPSMMWPVWHGLGAVAVVAITFGAIVFGSSKFALGAIVVLLLLGTPSLLLSVRTCIVERRIASIPALAVLYFAYGLARAAALFK